MFCHLGRLQWSSRLIQRTVAQITMNAVTHECVDHGVVHGDLCWCDCTIRAAIYYQLARPSICLALFYACSCALPYTFASLAGCVIAHIEYHLSGFYCRCLPLGCWAVVCVNGFAMHLSNYPPPQIIFIFLPQEGVVYWGTTHRVTPRHSRIYINTLFCSANMTIIK